jgi:putative ABC transport system permease protein
MMRASFSQILSSMRHRRLAYLSLAAEVALGSTVVTYMLALGAGLSRIALDPIGLDEERLFTVAIEQPPHGSTEQRRSSELAELRALPDVAAAAWIELPPLSRRELQEQLTTPDGPRLVWTMSGDENLIDALGVELAEGHGFVAEDTVARSHRPVVVTRALAMHFGPSPLGQTLRSDGYGLLRIVGVIDGPLRVGPFYTRDSEVALIPAQPSEARRTTYVVRTAHASTSDWSASAAATLRGSGSRFVAIERLADTRQYYVRNVSGASTVILITVFGMVTVVLVGSLGMASSLIVERTRQIGVRRALGATKNDITHYFMLENLLATLVGLIASAALCALLDRLLQPIKGELVIDWPGYLKIAVAMFLVSGQAAVFWPARRAAHIPPSVASRPA